MQHSLEILSILLFISYVVCFQDIHRLLSTKSPYWNQSAEGGTPEIEELRQCTLVQMNYVIRHGTRNPSFKVINKVTKLAKRLQSDANASLLPDWLKEWQSPYDVTQANLLVDRGVSEMIHLAKRIRLEFAKKFQLHYDHSHYKFTHTWKERTAQSAAAFAYGYFDGVQPINYIIEDDLKLRFFDICPKYESTIKTNESASREYSEYLSTTRMLRNVYSVRKQLGLSEATQLTAKDVVTMFSGCAFDVAVFNITDHWCSLFKTEEMLRSMDYHGDLKAYWKKGFGHNLSWEIAAPLLKDIFDSVKQFTEGKNDLVGHFRFAHAETILPLICLLTHNWVDAVELQASTPEEIAWTRSFKASILAPFAGNVAFHLYQCGSTYKIQTRFNEQNVQISGCHASGYLCTLDEFEASFRQFLYEWVFSEECCTDCLKPQVQLQ